MEIGPERGDAENLQFKKAANRLAAKRLERKEHLRQYHQKEAEFRSSLNYTSEELRDKQQSVEEELARMLHAQREQRRNEENSNNLPTDNSDNRIKRIITDFIKAPSQHPLSLSLIAATLATSAGLPMITIAAAFVGVFSGCKLRDYLYSSDIELNSVERENEYDAHDEGVSAGRDWIGYFAAFKTLNNWRHPIAFGHGMKQEMNERVSNRKSAPQ